ncbi:hypothetical protein DPMN_066153 [Dreissena polymorpha]|uniref:Uncharacterized protein n=1 Tax=Dreissena polymorpha TaxID=45954 RepID=A0A9D3YVT9_DREPO|nr:hypothetical protein DPMN_066153 [Dreissena polymorpha]
MAVARGNIYHDDNDSPLSKGMCHFQSKSFIKEYGYLSVPVLYQRFQSFMKGGEHPGLAADEHSASGDPHSPPVKAVSLSRLVGTCRC